MAKNRRNKAVGPVAAEKGQQVSVSPLAPTHSQLLSKSHLMGALSSATTFFSRIPRRLRLLTALRPGHRNEPGRDPKPSSTKIEDINTEPKAASDCNVGQGDDDNYQPMSQTRSQKEQQLTPSQSLAISLSRLTVGVQPEKVPLQKNLEIRPPCPPDRTPEEKKAHERFTNEALEMARLALRTNETPVGCVLVHNGTVIAKGMNATNVTRNGTRHAEFMALSALFALPREDGAATSNSKSKQKVVSCDYATTTDGTVAGEEQIAKGHLYPYGQKFHPAPRVAKSIINECILYVTVEPCVMCASLLRQLGIKKVYFGAVNDKFGGTGGVFRIHQNTSDLRTRQAEPVEEVGHGGNIEPGFEAEGGWGRDEAVGLLRRFYVQENGRAPVPRKKEGRAARLAALEREAAGRNSMLEGSQNQVGEIATEGFHPVPGGGFLGIDIGCSDVDKENMAVSAAFEKEHVSEPFASDENQLPMGKVVVKMV